MPKIGIGGTGNIDHIQMDEQGSNPSTPAAGKSGIFLKADGLYVIDDAGAVTGPLVAAAGGGADVAARYSTNAGQSFTNGAAAAIVDFEDLTFDTHTAVTTGAAWKFTCPAGQGGYYLVKARVLLAGYTGWNFTERGWLTLHKNNSATPYSTLDRQDQYESSGSLLMSLQGSDLISLVATDTVDIRLTQNSGANIALQTDGQYNYIDIVKVKG